MEHPCDSQISILNSRARCQAKVRGRVRVTGQKHVCLEPCFDLERVQRDFDEVHHLVGAEYEVQVTAQSIQCVRLMSRRQLRFARLRWKWPSLNPSSSIQNPSFDHIACVPRLRAMVMTSTKIFWRTRVARVYHP